jgi:hypothetical protein
LVSPDASEEPVALLSIEPLLEDLGEINLRGLACRLRVGRGEANPAKCA